MTDAAKVWAVIPAAGTGTRMAADEPKQYLSIASKTILEYTLDKVLSWEFVHGVMVALRSDDSRFEHLSISRHARVRRCSGGVERSDSVLAAMNALADCAQESDWVMVHDAARPCIRRTEVESLYRELAEGDVGGLLALPVADTVKRADNSDRVSATVDRGNLWLAQTPQLFRYGMLKRALELTLEQRLPVTDEAAAVEQTGGEVKLVPGHSSNIKITHPQDLVLARMWLTVEGLL